MRALKTILFHLLLALRRIIKLILRIFAGLILFDLAGMFVFEADVSSSVKLIMFASFVGLAALSWYYDVLLLKLAPDNVNLTLYS